MSWTAGRLAAVAIGLLVTSDVRAFADEATNASRKTIIESTRDDVRRKIEERKLVPSERPGEVSSDAKPASNPKPDPHK